MGNSKGKKTFSFSVLFFVISFKFLKTILNMWKFIWTSTQIHQSKIENALIVEWLNYFNNENKVI